MPLTKRFRKKTLYWCSAIAMMAGATGTGYAFIDIDSFKTNPAAIASIAQSDQAGAVLEVNRAQTARTPADIGKSRIATLTENLAAEQAVQSTKNIVQSIEDVTFGKGITPTMACTATEEKKSHTVKQELSSQVRTAISQSNAAMHFAKDGDRRAMRAKQHYEKYCDITEVAQGACLASPNSKGGMDTDYGNIQSNLTLDDEQIDAAYGFMHNIIDPAKSDYSFCDTLACEAISQTEAQYHALGSMVQNAFLNQMQDAIAYDTPPNVASSITVEQKGALSEPWDGRLARWGEAVYVGGGGGGGGGGTFSLENLNLSPEMRALLEGISHGEAGSPEAYNRGQNCGWQSRKYGDGVTKITSMTPQQLLDRYNNAPGTNYKRGNIDCSQRLFATGLFQTVPETLNHLLKTYPQYRHKPYTAEVQVMFAMQLLKENRAVRGYLSGRHTDIDRAVQGIAQIWASIAVPAGMSRFGNLGTSNGRHSYYSGGNKANMQSTAMVRQALMSMQGKKQEGF